MASGIPMTHRWPRVVLSLVFLSLVFLSLVLGCSLGCGRYTLSLSGDDQPGADSRAEAGPATSFVDRGKTALVVQPGPAAREEVVSRVAAIIFSSRSRHRLL